MCQVFSEFCYKNLNLYELCLLFIISFNLFGVRAPEFDMSELESLFSAAAPNPNDGKGGKSNRRSAQKVDKVQLVCLFINN